jgi:hypothetical protein
VDRYPGFQSRRDVRTQPGPKAFGPGDDPKNARPEGAVEIVAKIGKTPAKPSVDHTYLPPLQGGSFLEMFQGLKPRLSPYVPSGLKPRLPVCIFDPTSSTPLEVEDDDEYDLIGSSSLPDPGVTSGKPGHGIRQFRQSRTHASFKGL